MLQQRKQLLPVDHPHPHCDLLLLRELQQLRLRLQRWLQQLLLINRQMEWDGSVPFHCPHCGQAAPSSAETRSITSL